MVADDFTEVPDQLMTVPELAAFLEVCAKGVTAVAVDEHGALESFTAIVNDG